MSAPPFLAVLQRALRFRWAVVLAVLVPAALVGVLAVETRADHTTVVTVVGVSPESADVVSTDAVQLGLGRYSVALTSPEVLREVADETGIDATTLDAAIDVTASQEAGNLTVRVTPPRAPTQATAVARAVTAQAVRIGEEDPLADAGGPGRRPQRGARACSRAARASWRRCSCWLRCSRGSSSPTPSRPCGPGCARAATRPTPPVAPCSAACPPSPPRGPVAESPRTARSWPRRARCAPAT